MIEHLSYDEPVLSHHRLVSSLAAKELPPGGTLLDVGCGLGQMMELVHRELPDVALWGIDGDPTCVAAATERLPGAVVRLGDAADLTAFGPSTVDVVVMSHSLEHFVEPVRVLHAAMSLLTPSGRLVLAVPNALQATVIARELAGRGRSNDGHYYIWNRATFENCLALAGLRVVEHHHDDVPVFPQRVRHRVPRAVGAVERTVSRALPALSYSVIVVAEPRIR